MPRGVGYPKLFFLNILKLIYAYFFAHSPGCGYSTKDNRKVGRGLANALKAQQPSKKTSKLLTEGLFLIGFVWEKRWVAGGSQGVKQAPNQDVYLLARALNLGRRYT